jgi:phosphoribosylformimino-5-aminoimidazole carboxamide ribotide isomerase
MMNIYPAIDLMGEKCVRLFKGSFENVFTFDADPIDAARRWRDQGAKWLHIIDLDGAREGHPKHLELITAIIRAVDLPVRLGGGLRTREDVAAAFAAGATQVFLGTAALDERLLQDLITRWGKRIEVALDRRGEELAVDGWQKSGGNAASWARRATQLGVRSFLVTDITRDGSLQGANIDLVAQTRAEAGDPSVGVTIAGGVTTVEDIRALIRAKASGAVIGRALYDGRISLPEAIAAAREEETYLAH